jgi:transcriptional regulator with XRE-family HTH domain
MVKRPPAGHPGIAIALEREAQGLSIAELARRSGVPAASISNYERGVGRPSRIKARKLAEALGKTTEELFGPGELTQEPVSRLTTGREAAGLQIYQLSDITGIPSDSLSNYEHGKGRPSRYAARKIAEALDMTVEAIFGYGDINEGIFAIKPGDSPSRRARKRRHLTLEALSGQLRMTISNLSQIERGEINPPLDVQERMARALSEDRDNLFGPYGPRETVLPTDSKLTRARKEAGLSKLALARVSGIHDSQLRRYESGKYFPNLDNLRALCKALNKRPFEIFVLPGTPLEQARVGRLLDPKTVADKIGVTVERYTRYERNKQLVPHSVAVDLARLFNVPQHMLFEPKRVRPPVLPDQLECANCRDPYDPRTNNACPHCGYSKANTLRFRARHKLR